jgi:hypothetical protein
MMTMTGVCFRFVLNGRIDYPAIDSGVRKARKSTVDENRRPGEEVEEVRSEEGGVTGGGRSGFRC